MRRNEHLPINPHLARRLNLVLDRMAARLAFRNVEILPEVVTYPATGTPIVFKLWIARSGKFEIVVGAFESNKIQHDIYQRSDVGALRGLCLTTFSTYDTESDAVISDRQLDTFISLCADPSRDAHR